MQSSLILYHRVINFAGCHSWVQEGTWSPLHALLVSKKMWSTTHANLSDFFSSCMCSLFIIFIIFLFKKYKFLSQVCYIHCSDNQCSINIVFSFVQRLILYLAIAAFFQAIGYVMVSVSIHE